MYTYAYVDTAGTATFDGRRRTVDSYIYMCICVYVYICILCIYMCVCVCIYIHILQILLPSMSGGEKWTLGATLASNELRLYDAAEHVLREAGV